MVNFLAAWC